MADLVINRGVTVAIAIKIPKEVWDRWEAQHAHFGKAIHELREALVQTMSERTMRSWTDASYELPPEIRDPFWKQI